MEFRSTRHQVARGSRPDAERGGNIYLVKHVALLRLTYQIRLLTYMAEVGKKRLTIVVPHGSQMSGDMKSFAQHHQGSLSVELSR